MSRRYAKVGSHEWTRGALRRLRGDLAAQVLYTYLLSSPHATMLGLFFCAPATVAAETGLDPRQVRKAIGVLERESFAFHDPDTDVWYVPELATQLGPVKPGDRRRVKLAALFSEVKHSALAGIFVRQHGTALGLDLDAPSRRPIPAVDGAGRGVDSPAMVERRSVDAPTHGASGDHPPSKQVAVSSKQQAGSSSGDARAREAAAAPSAKAAFVVNRAVVAGWASKLTRAQLESDWPKTRRKMTLAVDGKLSDALRYADSDPQQAAFRVGQVVDGLIAAVRAGDPDAIDRWSDRAFETDWFPRTEEIVERWRAGEGKQGAAADGSRVEVKRGASMAALLEEAR